MYWGSFVIVDVFDIVVVFIIVVAVAVVKLKLGVDSVNNPHQNISEGGVLEFKIWHVNYSWGFAWV